MVGETYLITGGTGSLGRVITQQLLDNYNPKSIRILSRNEYYQFEMKQHFNNKVIRFLIGDVRDRDRIHRATQGCDVVIHAAALKHVSFCEYNPIEAVKTNIMGSINVIESALDNHVEKVIAISSDKAVSPINLYGATKSVMEKLFIDANVYGGKFSCIRFGNFIGSKGSLIDTLGKQPEKIDVPHKKMARYWITLQDAAQFTIKCLEDMAGGEIFIPKMAMEYVTDVISGKSPNTKIEITDLEVPEKIYEDLLTEYESKRVEEREDCWILSQR